MLNTIGAQTYTGQVTVGGTNVNLLTVSANNMTTIYGGANGIQREIIGKSFGL